MHTQQGMVAGWMDITFVCRQWFVLCTPNGGAANGTPNEGRPWPADGQMDIMNEVEPVWQTLEAQARLVSSWMCQATVSSEQ